MQLWKKLIILFLLLSLPMLSYAKESPNSSKTKILSEKQVLEEYAKIFETEYAEENFDYDYDYISEDFTDKAKKCLH